MNKQIINDLQWRYTTKKYAAGKKIPPADLDTLLAAIRLSASSINAQPWRFVVLESDTAKQRMHQTFTNKHQFNQPHILDCSHVILFAHNPHYSRGDYEQVIDTAIKDKRTKAENRDAAFAAFAFAQSNTDANGNNSHWTKAQLYLALGNTLHTLARLKIDSTPMEGIDTDLVNQEFKQELAGYRCELALAIGYRHPTEDYNATLAKSRLSLDRTILKI